MYANELGYSLFFDIRRNKNDLRKIGFLLPKEGILCLKPGDYGVGRGFFANLLIH
jgi:hypothetical protein